MANSSDTVLGGTIGRRLRRRGYGQGLRPRSGEPAGPNQAPARAGITAVALAGLILIATACTGAGAGDQTESEGGSEGDGQSDTVLVFAAASLTDVMAEAEVVFEAANPAIDITLNLAGSASLRTQILEGAPADVIATANPTIMDELVDASRIADRPTTLASNELVIAVAWGNPAEVGQLADLTDPDRFIGLCASEVPCGDLADRAATAADLVIDADTREPDVRSLLAKIEAGELDAGLVYRTDVVASGSGVTAIDLPVQLPTTTDYPVATLTESDNPAAAEAFVAFLTGPEGRRILTDHGFQVP